MARLPLGAHLDLCHKHFIVVNYIFISSLYYLLDLSLMKGDVLQNTIWIKLPRLSCQSLDAPSPSRPTQSLFWDSAGKSSFPKSSGNNLHIGRSLLLPLSFPHCLSQNNHGGDALLLGDQIFSYLHSFISFWMWTTRSTTCFLDTS